MPAHGLAYISGFNFSISNPNFSLLSAESTTTNYKASSFSQASQLRGTLISVAWVARTLSSSIRRKTVPEPWLPTTPSPDARCPTCLEPPWLGGMFCAGSCPSCPLSAALPASSCRRRCRGQPELAMLSQQWCPHNTSHRALPWPPAERSLSRAMSSVYWEPELLPRCTSPHALRKGGNGPRRTFPSKVKESIPPPCMVNEKEKKITQSSAPVMLSHRHGLPITVTGSGCYNEWPFHSI